MKIKLLISFWLFSVLCFGNSNLSTFFKSEINSIVRNVKEFSVQSHTHFMSESGVLPPPCVSPNPAGSLTFSAIDDRSITVDFVASTSITVDKYLVVRSTNATLSNFPISGAVYTVGQTLGDGIVISVSNANSIIAASLEGGTQYYFFVYALDEDCTGGPVYSNVNSNSAFTKPSVANDFSEICTTNNSQDLSWSAPLSGAFDGYLLVAREAEMPHSVASINPITSNFNLDYTLATEFGSTNQKSKILYLGNTTNATVVNLTQGMSYTFALYTYKTIGGITKYSTATTRTQTVVLPNVVNGLSDVGNQKATLSWANPNCYDQILVVATTTAGIGFNPSGDGSSYVANATFTADNQIVYANTNNSCTITGLTNGVTYYFEIFTRKGLQWSSGIEVSATPLNIADPTVFKTGDLVLISYDNYYNNSGDDAFQLLTLVDIHPGTSFILANATYETGGKPTANSRSNKWYSCSASPTGKFPYLQFTYKTSNAAVIPSGTIICITTDGVGNNSTISAISNTVSGTATSFPQSAFSILGKNADGSSALHSAINSSSSSPDALFLMQGIFNYAITGTTFVGNVLSGVQSGGTWYELSDDLSALSGDNLRRSRKHPQLLCSAIQAATTNEKYEFKYNPSTLAMSDNSKGELLNYILNISNWTGGIQAGPDFACPSFSPFKISGASTAVNWTGVNDTNWFNCNNWSNLRVPDNQTNVTISNSANQNASINCLNDYANLHDQIAQCADLTLSDKSLQIKGSSNNKLQINGNLTITGSGEIDMDDAIVGTADGQLYLMGNWTNEVDESHFKQGESTVHLVGTVPQVINAVLPDGTETFYNLNLGNNFTTSVSNDLKVEGDLTISNGKSLTISTDDFASVAKKVINNGSLTIENDGSLVQTEDGITNTGSITVERTASIRLYDYVYWSAPVADFLVTSLSPNTPSSAIYKWNSTIANSNNGFGNWQNTTENMLTGVGYIVRAPNNYNATVHQDFKATFRGIPNNGIYDVPVQRGNYTGANYLGRNGVLLTNANDNWNLIGNPYPSSIDALDFLSANPNIEGAVRLWTHGTLPNASNLDPFYGDFAYNYTAADYLIHNGTATLSGPTGYNGLIGAGQSFFVLMNDGIAATETVRFSNSMRSRLYSNDQFYRGASGFKNDEANEKHRIWLDLIAPSKTVTRTVIGYVPGATNEKDRLYDALTDYSSSQNFYSLIDSEIVCIQGRPVPFTTADSVPLGVKIPSNGTYTIAVAAIDGLFLSENQTLYLEDTELNTIHNLSEKPYIFTIDKGIANNRFVLRYTSNSLGKSMVEESANEVIVTTGDRTITILSKNEPLQKVIISDITGRIIKTENNSNTSTSLSVACDRNNQPLLVQIYFSNGQTRIKKILF